MVSKTVGHVKAVDGVTFNLKRGTTMGLVGESGCGKTTTGRTILRLSGDKTGGQVLFNGREVYDLTPKETARPCARRCRSSSRIPSPACLPVLPVGEIIGEAVREHGLVPQGRVRRLYRPGHGQLRLAALPQGPLSPRVLRRPAPAHLHRPRAGAEPRVRRLRRAGLRAGRVHSGADHQPAASELQKKYDLTYLFISHDLSVVEHISDTRGRHVSGQSGGVRRDGGYLPRTRCTPTPRRCSPPSRCPDPNGRR